MKYYGLLQAWNKDRNNTLSFSDSHKKTYQVRDSSTIKTLQNRLLERMRSSKNMLIIISKDTSWDRGMLNFEIEKAVDYYEIPLIVAYVGWEIEVFFIDGKFNWISFLTQGGLVALGELGVMLVLGTLLYVVIVKRKLDQKLFIK